ncbi:TPA: host cell division inhibitory peptide Kil, partial [Escherichia coli]
MAIQTKFTIATFIG